MKFANYSNSSIWQLQLAKAKFSEFVRAASIAPQAVSVRGEIKAVMVPLHYIKEQGGSKPLFEELLNSIPTRI